MATCTENVDTQNLTPILTELVQKCRVIQESNPRIYEYSMTEDLHSNSVRILSSGQMDKEKPTKRILLVGATGAGKTTLLNAMLNYILGIQYESDIRFKMILDEGEEHQKHNQAKGQTSCVSVYKIPYNKGMMIDYNLVLIDTPGFGDEGGIYKDKRVAKQIEDLFLNEKNDINRLNCVSFLVKSSNTRFTPSERYVFDSILQLFGKDMENSISMMITFVDSVTGEPGVLAALKESEVNYKKHFKFNNRSLFSKSNSSGNTEWQDDLEKSLAEIGKGDISEEQFAKMNAVCFKFFFRHVESLDERSLKLTNEVIKIRHQLELDIGKIKLDIDKGVRKLNEMEDYNLVIMDRQRDLEQKKYFEYKIRETISIKVDLSEGKFATNCNKCQMVCHDDCRYSCINSTVNCVAMEHSFYPPRCKVCDNCEYKYHSTDTFKYELSEKWTQKTSADLKTRFPVEEDSVNEATQMLTKVKDEFMNIQLDVMKKVLDLKKATDRLNDIALRPHSRSQIDYIDKLILVEENQRKVGYDDRIKQLSELKSMIQSIIDLTHANEDPFKPYLDNLEAKLEQKAAVYKLSEEFKRKLQVICSELKDQQNQT